MEFTLLGAVAFAVVPLYLVLYWEAKRGNAAECTRDLWEIAITAAVVGVFVGRIAAMLGDGVNPLTNPADILIVRGGVATGPAAVGALVAVAWMGRAELWQVVDGLAAGALAGLGGWHAGCVVRDACLGTPSDLPWAIAQSGGTVTRHPVEIYAAILLLVAAAAVATWRRLRFPPVGVAAGVALGTAGLVRLATEHLRPSLGGGPILWYLAALVAAGGIAWWRLLIHQRPVSPQL